MKQIEIDIKLIEGGKIPEKKTEGAIGFDCYARTNVVIPIFGTAKIPLGFALGLPMGYYVDIRPRSGNSLKGIIGHLGLVDSDYRGEIHAIVTNLTGESLVVSPGDRIAQMVLHVEQFLHDEIITAFNMVNQLDKTERGSNGFGSTGK